MLVFLKSEIVTMQRRMRADLEEMKRELVDEHGHVVRELSQLSAQIRDEHGTVVKELSSCRSGTGRMDREIADVLALSGRHRDRGVAGVEHEVSGLDTTQQRLELERNGASGGDALMCSPTCLPKARGEAELDTADFQPVLPVAELGPDKSTPTLGRTTAGSESRAPYVPRDRPCNPGVQLQYASSQSLLHL